MSEETRITELKTLLAEYEADRNVLRAIASRQRWLGKVVPLLSFNPTLHSNAMQFADLMVAPGFSWSHYERLEARIMLLVRQGVAELSRGLVEDVSPMATADKRRVFVVHGRNGKARDAMFNFLRALCLQPIEWAEAIRLTGKTAPFIGEILDAAFSNAQAVVVLMTPDDVAFLNLEYVVPDDPPHEREPTPQARPNVLFEAGMAMGRDQGRTVLVQLGTIRPFSDIGGRHVVRINNTSQRRQDLAERLVTAGCKVDITGRDWHTVGDFEGALPASTSVPWLEPVTHEITESQMNLLSDIDQCTKSKAKGISLMMLDSSMGFYVPYIWSNAIHGGIEKCDTGDISHVVSDVNSLEELGYLAQHHNSKHLWQWRRTPKRANNASPSPAACSGQHKVNADIGSPNTTAT